MKRDLKAGRVVMGVIPVIILVTLASMPIDGIKPWFRVCMLLVAGGWAYETVKRVGRIIGSQ